MAFNPLVSVVISNYNYSKFVHEAIDSVLAQTYKKLEIIVVDDGSTDNSLEIIAGYSSKIKVISKQNAGVSSARNIGLSQAKGEYICFLDSDDVWRPEKVEVQISLLYDAPKACIYTGVQFIDERGATLGLMRPKYRGNVWRQYLWHPGRAIVPVGCSNAILPTNIAKQIGGFNQRFSMSADWDFFRKVADTLEIAYDSKILVSYRQHSSSMSRADISEYYKETPSIYRDALTSWLAQKKLSTFKAKIAWALFIFRLSYIFIRNRKFAAFLELLHSESSFKPHKLL